MKKNKSNYDIGLAIVNDLLTNNANYKETMTKYNISYANVYNWFNKYKKYGNVGIIDKRGRPSINKIDKKEHEILKLKQELNKSNKAIEVLKK